MTKLYIAGPMSGIPQFNFPAFIAAGKCIRKLGYETLNPAEIDLEDDNETAMESTTGDLSDVEKTWGDYLSRDVKLVADECDGVALLPGWENSRGARLEAFIAINCKKPVYQLFNGDLVEADNDDITESIVHHTLDQGDTTRYEQ